MKFEKIEDVKSNNYFYINNYVDDTKEKVKCVWNDVENKRMEITYYVLIFKQNVVLDYNHRCFKSFKTLNS